jgi:hypothetical protein
VRLSNQFRLLAVLVSLLLALLGQVVPARAATCSLAGATLFGTSSTANTTRAATSACSYDRTANRAIGGSTTPPLRQGPYPSPAGERMLLQPQLRVFPFVVAAEGGASIENANFAQTTASNSFSTGGSFSGQTISDVADELNSGALSLDNVPIQVIERDGNTLILNIRSALALEQAGIPRSEWVVDNVTGDPAAEARLSGQLARNGLGSGGTSTVRITGGG